MNNAQKSLIGLVALGSALVMPIAFAQSATTPTTDATAQSATPTEQAAAPTEQAPTEQTAAPTEQAAVPTADAKKVTWADLDADKDGSLSKSEVAPLASLSEVFEQADTDADGKLTANEYKAYVAKNGKGAPDKQG